MEQTDTRKAYLLINIIFAGVILFIMGYSFFYSPYEDKYPVVCIHEKLTGEKCPSCGMSHAFSLIVRGKVDEALLWNSYSLRVFMFFSVQLVIRILLGAWCLFKDHKIRLISRIDAGVSAVMTLAAFYPFLRMIWLTAML